MNPTTDTFDDTILANLDGTLSPEAASNILQLKFSADQQQRMSDLVEQSRSGELNEQDRREADSFERVNMLLGILQSRARMTLS